MPTANAWRLSSCKSWSWPDHKLEIKMAEGGRSHGKSNGDPGKWIAGTHELELIHGVNEKSL